MWSEMANSEATACACLTPAGGFKNQPSWVDSSMYMSGAEIIHWQDNLACSGERMSECIGKQVR